MTEQTIREMNAVIGLFHNRTLEKGENGEPDKYLLMGACYTTDPLTMGYHSDWGQLMPVWIKFRSLMLEDIIYSRWCNALGWYLYSSDQPIRFFERLYYAIQWYNKNKQNG